MATDFENLKARRTAIYAELAAMAVTKAGGLPNARDSGVDHVGYKDGLYRELREINAILGDGGGFGGDSQNCFEIVEEGYTP
jgi:hypothetical protein